MNDRVFKAEVARELVRRETLRVAESLLSFLREWASTGETFTVDLSGVAADSNIPEGSLAHHLEEPAKCNALARVSSDPATLLSLLVAYEKAAVRAA